MVYMNDSSGLRSIPFLKRHPTCRASSAIVLNTPLAGAAVSFIGISENLSRGSF
jgi:hypothetical protein